MSSAAILFIRDGSWRLGALFGRDLRVENLDFPACGDPGALAEAARAKLSELCRLRNPLVLAAPSSWCLAAPLNAVDMPRRHRRQAMKYLLEEHLPVAAEDLLPAFIGEPPNVLGIGVLRDRIEPLYAALIASDLPITAVVPASLLALQEAQRRSDLPIDAWVDAHDGRTEILLLREGQPAAWHVVAAQSKAIQLIISHDEKQLRREPTVAATDEASAVLRLHGAGPCGSASELLVRAAQRSAGAWANLRPALAGQDTALGRIRMPLAAAAASLATLLVVFAAANLLTTVRSRSIEREALAQQRTFFESVAPDQSAPINVRSRLESMARELSATRRGTGVVPHRAEAFTGLHAILSRLPADVRLRVAEIRLDGHRLYVEGQTRSHADAEALAVAIRTGKSGPALAVDPPRSDALRDRGVTFSLQGHVVAAPATDGPRGAP